MSAIPDILSPEIANRAHSDSVKRLVGQRINVTLYPGSIYCDEGMLLKLGAGGNWLRKAQVQHDDGRRKWVWQSQCSARPNAAGELRPPPANQK